MELDLHDLEWLHILLVQDLRERFHVADLNVTVVKSNRNEVLVIYAGMQVAQFPIGFVDYTLDHHLLLPQVHSDELTRLVQTQFLRPGEAEGRVDEVLVAQIDSITVLNLLVSHLDDVAVVAKGRFSRVIDVRATLDLLLKLL